MSSSADHSDPSLLRNAIVLREVSVTCAVDMVVKKDTPSDSIGAANKYLTDEKESEGKREACRFDQNSAKVDAGEYRQG